MNVLCVLSTTPKQFSILPCGCMFDDTDNEVLRTCNKPDCRRAPMIIETEVVKVTWWKRYKQKKHAGVA